MKTLNGGGERDEVKLQEFLTMVLGMGEVSMSGETAHWCPLHRGLDWLRSWHTEKSLPYREQIPDRPVRNQSLYLLSYIDRCCYSYKCNENSEINEDHEASVHCVTHCACCCSCNWHGKIDTQSMCSATATSRQAKMTSSWKYIASFCWSWWLLLFRTRNWRVVRKIVFILKSVNWGTEVQRSTDCDRGCTPSVWGRRSS